MNPEKINVAEFDDRNRRETDRLMVDLLERIRNGEMPEGTYTLDGYLKVVATEKTHDNTKSDDENKRAMERELTKLKVDAAREGITNELIAQHQKLEKYFNAIDEQSGAYESTLSRKTFDELLADLKQGRQKAGDIATLAQPVQFFLSFLKNGKALASLVKAENTLGLGALGRMVLSQLPEETREFIQELAGQKLSTIELVQLGPFLLEVIKRPNYLLFDPNIKPESVILTTTQDFITVNKKPVLGESVNRKIRARTIESDLLILNVQNPDLAKKIKDVMQQVSNKAPRPTGGQGQQSGAFNIPPAQLTTRIETLEKVAAKHKEYLAANATTPQDTEAETDAAAGRGSENDPFSVNPVQQEKRVLEGIKATIQNKIASLEGATTTETRTPGQKEDLEMWALAKNFIEFNISPKDFIKEVYKPEYKKAQIRVVLKRYIELHPELRQSPPSEVTDSIRAEVVGSWGTTGEERLEDETAIETRSTIEKMLKHLTMTMYTDVVEAGGEPDVDFNTAVSKTVTGWSASAKQMIQVLTKRLTVLKTAAAGIASSEKTALSGGVRFASPHRAKTEEYINDKGQRRQVLDVDITHRCESTNAAFADFASSLEIGFSTFNDAIEGSYSMRYFANMDGAKYFDYLDDEKFKPHINSKTFDLYHATAGSELAAQIVPTVKMIMMDFFNERGWIIGQELEEEVFGHKNTIYSQVNHFLQQNYPELSDSKRREVAYIAIHQTYAHFQFQQMLSRTRGTVGYQGKLYGDENAHFSVYRKGHSFGDYETPWGLTRHELWGRGQLALGGWFDPGTTKWEQFTDPGKFKFEGITHTAAYGGLIEFGSRQFGHFLSYTDEHFDGTLPRTMMPYNMMNGGSDDKLRSWRQNNKVIGNISTSLYERKPASDDIVLNSKYEGADHLTNIWKSVENVGINYIRSLMETMTADLAIGTDGMITDAVKSPEAKYEHLFKFLFNRYFKGDPSDGEKITTLRTHMLSTIPELQGKTVSDADTFWAALKDTATKTKSVGFAKSVLWRVYSMMLAERNPMTFMTIESSWTTQTGETLWSSIKKKYEEDTTAGFAVAGEKKLNMDVWNETRNDLILVQSEARGSVTKRVKEKRRDWQTDTKLGKTFDRNIFGDFSKDRSDVSIDGKTQGYIVTEDAIEQVLRKKFASKPDLEQRITRAKRMYGDILMGMTETPDLPEYDIVKKFMDDNIKEAYKEVKDEKKPQYAELIAKRIGSSKDEYEKKFGNRKRDRSDWFVHLWQDGFLGIEPEADYAEDLTIYQNADENHIKRMAGIVKLTTCEMKKLLSDPDNELSITEMGKAFAKDPMAAIETMATYLNKFRKIITRERGPDYAVRYLNWYVTTILDSAVKDDEYRSGLGLGGWLGVWNDFIESMAPGLGHQNKMSLGSDRFQVFIGHSLSAREGNAVIRQLLKKKLLNAPTAELLQKRLRATVPDVIWEVAPYLCIFLLWNMYKKAVVEPLGEAAGTDDKKKK